MISREKFLAFLISHSMRLLFATLRLRVVDHAGFTTSSSSSSSPVIIAFWHNRICAVTLTFLRKYPRTRRGVMVLTSPSRDGEILAQVMAAFRMGSVRGSSSRRGGEALLALTAKLRQGFDIAITPDGPRGPKYCLHPGLIFLARSTGAQILPIHARFSRALRLKSWDGFRIPVPFSRVEVTIGPYESVAEEQDAFERARLESILKNEAD
ncbi:MAG: hypothetical protein C5B47_01815 [Verrucomicrobia bacterium]|nr:MAG: hypothetical protein C5B47_01815 [Verrucomicrobiota bacterium]